MTAVVAVPLAIERLALGRLPGVPVVRVGGGVRRAERAAARLAGRSAVVVGVAGGLRAGLRPGDVVVADEVRDDDGAVPCSTGIAAALRAAGLTVHIGPVVTVGHLVDGAERAALAATGAIAVDTESAPLMRVASHRVVVRAIADTPDRPLRSLHTVRGGIAALRAISRAAPALAGWARTKEVG